MNFAEGGVTKRGEMAGGGWHGWGLGGRGPKNTARPDFSLKNLTSNPTFNFVNNLCDNNDNFDPNSNNFIQDSPYATSIFSCSYSDPVVFAQTNLNLKQFSIMTLNIQSISSKFDELSELIVLLQTFKCSPDIICLQELWQFPKNAVFSLPGYSPLVCKLRSGTLRGGGCWVLP
jgi:hypothetical protein